MITTLCDFVFGCTGYRSTHAESGFVGIEKIKYRGKLQYTYTMARIYTRSGDTGETGLIGGQRRKKCDLRIHAIGEIDELNAALGMARAVNKDGEIDGILATLQDQLFNLGCILAINGQTRVPCRMIDEEDVYQLEKWIDKLNKNLPPLKEFILPAGALPAANLHFARAVCRRAERCIVELATKEEILPIIAVFLNRLSDLLFVMARAANQRHGIQEIIWNPETKG